MNGTLFEILVYTVDQQTFVARVTAEVDAVMDEVPDYKNGFWEEQREDLIRRSLRPVRYNEIVGCIMVYRFDAQLRAGYSFTNRERIVIGSKGVIRPVAGGDLVQRHYDPSRLSSREIFDDFRATLGRAVENHRRLTRRFVDFAAFDRIGPSVDWRGILNLCGAAEEPRQS